MEKDDIIFRVRFKDQKTGKRKIETYTTEKAALSAITKMKGADKKAKEKFLKDKKPFKLFNCILSTAIIKKIVKKTKAVEKKPENKGAVKKNKDILTDDQFKARRLARQKRLNAK